MFSDFEDWVTGLILGGMVVGLALTMIDVANPNQDAQIQLGIGFANQSCIDKGMVLNHVEKDVDSRLPLIICDKKSDTHIDGQKYLMKWKMNNKDKIERLNKVKELVKNWTPFNSENILNKDLASLMGYESYEDMPSMDDFYTDELIKAWCKGFEEGMKWLPLTDWSP